MQQNSCPSFLRLVLVFGLCISYSPTFSFFILILFIPSFLVDVISFSIGSYPMAWKYTLVFQIKERNAFNTSPLSNFEPFALLTFKPNFSKRYLYCGRAGLLPNSHIPLSTAELVSAQAETIFPASLASSYSHVISSTNEIGAKIVCDF